MTRNEGTLDRALRIIAGLVLISLVFIGPQTPWGLDRPCAAGDRAGGHVPALLDPRDQYLPDEEGLSGAACAPAVEPMT